jgi:ABC-type Fe3+ transport system permease subunit
LAAVRIFDAAVYGEIGIASATTMKLVVIVVICMMILNYLTKKTGFDVSQKKGSVTV